MHRRASLLTAAIRLLALFVSALVVSACVRVGVSGGPIAFNPTAIAPVTPGAARLVAPGMPVLDSVPERPLYTLNVTLDYENNNVHAQERIEFRNPTGGPTTEIKFNVPLAHRAGVIEVRDARIFGQPQALAYELTNTVLTVKLPAQLAEKDGIALAFDFVMKIPIQEAINGIGGDDSSHGPGSLTGGHWYIMLAPFHDGTWDTPSYVPVGDPYVETLADYEVSFLAPENIVIAGGGDEQREGRLWRFTLPQARVFAFAASNSYVVDTIEQDGITYIHYGYARHRKFAEAVLYTAARAVKLYSQLYGPYPYKVLRIVETDRMQGQEYSGLVGIGTTLYEGYIGRGSRHDLISTTAHEVAHQWWFQQVGNDQVRTPWLDESFARISELRFYQKYYPRDADWWYKYYIVGASKPQGNIDQAIYTYTDNRSYIDGVYRRGLMFLNDLRNLIGTETFDAAMQNYYTAQVNKMTTPDAFFDTLARHTGEDISALTARYFASTPALPCKISNDAIGCRR
jgi:aminopeptidase N